MITLFRRRRIERFAQLLGGAGGAHHQASPLDTELAELVAIGQALSDPSEVRMDAARKAEMRAAILADPELQGIAATARAAAPTKIQPLVPLTSLAASMEDTALLAPIDDDVESVPGRTPVRAARPVRISGRRGRFTVRVRARVAVLAGLAVGTLAVSGISAASGSALPGDPLYGVKRSYEQIQIALASSGASKGRVYLQLAGVRLSEAEQVDSDNGLLTSTLNAMDNETKSGAALLFEQALAHQDSSALATVDAFTSAQAQELNNLLDAVSTGQAAVSGGRVRVLRSLVVLGAVEQRALSVHAALACGMNASTGTDPYGPIPAGCPGR